MLSTHDLSSGYGRIVVLRGISLAVGQPEIVAVLGRNGAGKTTLMKTLAGIVPAQSGTIDFFGTEIAKLSSDKRARLGIGYVPQGRGIFPKLSVRENLLVGLYASSGAPQIIDELLEEFPALKPKLNDRGSQLSGGQQQILALARALATNPKLLLLDEPSEGIQPSILEEIADILNRLKATRGLSTLIVEQNIDFIRSMADRAYLMDIGNITRQLSREELAVDGDWLESFVSGTEFSQSVA
ncbi:ABC transporter ATP-binding protein [Mesorhizobium kowhaii]|uniref:ABC transporter ATP-binding protein n=1 Tax=Mesorhizobium kowhaii TaxID=1300272 RepID=UPI0035EF7357